MSYNVVIISGSPQKNGSCASVVKAFEEGAVSSGHNVFRFDAAARDVHPCIGCLHCRARDNVCVFSDDMLPLYEQLKTADVLVLASPIYYWGFTAQIKAVIDRLFATGRTMGVKGSVLLVNAGGKDPASCGYDFMKMQYGKIAETYGWKTLGDLFVGGLTKDSTAADLPVIQQAFNMGSTLEL